MIVDDIFSHAISFSIASFVNEIFFVCHFVPELIENFNTEKEVGEAVNELGLASCRLANHEEIFATLSDIAAAFTLVEFTQNISGRLDVLLAIMVDLHSLERDLVDWNIV